MAEKKDQFIYSDEIRKLRNHDISRLYLLYGQEDYLKEVFSGEIKKTLFPEGDDGFSYKKFSDTDFVVSDIAEAIDAVPFLSEKTLVEIRDFDINRYGEQLLPVFSDIPEYCTVLLVQNSEYTPDFRLKTNKYLRDNYSVLNISVQGQNELTLWIRKRFGAEGKSIGREAAEQLIFLSGSSMSGLIPEIKKISASVKADTVETDDVRKYAHHLPEADVYEAVEQLSQGYVKKAAGMLSELLASKTAEPVQLLSIIALQYKRLYAVFTAKKHKKGTDWLISTEAVKFDWLARKMLYAPVKYTEEQFRRILSALAEADFRMKTGSGDNNDILKDMLIFLVSEVADVKAE